jgi:hypothetical protein
MRENRMDGAPKAEADRAEDQNGSPKIAWIAQKHENRVDCGWRANGRNSFREGENS